MFNAFTKALSESLRTLGPSQATRGVAQLKSLSVVTTIPSKTPLLNHTHEAAQSRRLLPERTGVLATKIGMMTWFEPNGDTFPCTVLEVDRLQVTHTKTLEKDGYYAVQVGAGSKDHNKVTRPLLGHFARAEVAPKRYVAEFQVKSAEGLLPLGTVITADHIKEGQFVDIKSRSKGKGFAGVMKRHHFHGLRATHGTTKKHRAAGSMGPSQDPGRVLPGKKMAGHMGFQNVTIQNSKVIKVDAEKGIILVKGPVSGAKGTVVKLSDAIKKLDAYVK
jgi:large subunit ribosomal protein L3